MSAPASHKPSKSDWDRVTALTDEQIDTSDVPPLGEAFFKNAKLRLPPGKVPLVLALDADLAEWFRSQEGDQQSLINAALRSFVEANRQKSA